MCRTTKSYSPFRNRRKADTKRALGYSIFTQANTLDELKTMLRDAVACHFTNGDKPSVIRLHRVKDEVIPA